MKKIKAILYVIILSTFFKVGNTFAVWGKESILPWLVWDPNNVDVTAQKYIVYLMTFLVLVAVIYWIYWGFLILTAWEDDDKVKKWKRVIVQSLIWIVVIFLAWPIVQFFIWDDAWTWWILVD